MTATIAPPRADRAHPTAPPPAPPPARAAPATVPAARTRLRAEVAVFLGITVAIAVAVSLCQRALGMDMAQLDQAPPLALALIPLIAGAPGIGAAAARLRAHRTLRGAGWGLRWRESRLALLGVALPLLYVSASYLTVYALGLGAFDADGLAAAAAQAFGAGDAAVPLYLLLSAGAGALAMGVLALFEEIGWRGFLVPALARLAPPGRVALLSGLAWAAFHFPLILLVPGAGHGLPSWYALTSFTLMVVLLSVPCAWLRLRARSLWPVVLLHTSHNVLVYSVFEPLTADTGITAYAQGELGFVLVVMAAPVALACWRPAARAAREWAADYPERLAAGRP